MTEFTTAQIIPFPTRQPEAAAPDRLATALGALSAALTEQQHAVQRWREAMDDLNGCMRALSAGVKQLNHASPTAP